MTPVFIARAKCGCIKAHILDTPDRRCAATNEMTKWRRQGWTPDRSTLEVVQAGGRCKAHRLVLAT